MSVSVNRGTVLPIRQKDRRRQWGQAVCSRLHRTNFFGWMHHFIYDNLCCKSRFLTPIEVCAWRPTAAVPRRLAIWTLRCRPIILYIVLYIRYGGRGLEPCRIHSIKPEDLSNRTIGILKRTNCTIPLDSHAFCRQDFRILVWSLYRISLNSKQGLLLFRN